MNCKHKPWTRPSKSLFIHDRFFSEKKDWIQVYVCPTQRAVKIIRCLHIQPRTKTIGTKKFPVEVRKNYPLTKHSSPLSYSLRFKRQLCTWFRDQKINRKLCHRGSKRHLFIAENHPATQHQWKAPNKSTFAKSAVRYFEVSFWPFGFLFALQSSSITKNQRCTCVEYNHR